MVYPEMEMIRVIAGVALIGAIFFVLWNKDRTPDQLVTPVVPGSVSSPRVSLRYVASGCGDISISRPTFVALKQQLAKK